MGGAQGSGRPVDLVVPVKHLDRAKSRLRGAVPGGHRAHLALVGAVVADTVAAATTAARRVLVVCEDPRVVDLLAPTGADCVVEVGLPGLNAALSFGAAKLRADDPGSVVGALQADLPAVSPADLRSAFDEAAGRRAFVPDRPGTGTALLLSGAGRRLFPRFGPGSAAAHGADAVAVGWGLAGLRCDVDTAEDLAAAVALGVGARTGAVVGGGAAGGEGAG
ncbi:2-phospho-L-lactate guanylyltransferase [Actinokineospora bangkokensis]|uniref:Phosphoenolpyruvate guanylyltransferase n=1 Tax=Actinokineospora bangkokensis TaxID=1193682 RepID=A0A1Q9LHV8_9PSEU|nr:2-phospho-L-lactate guanylyltransferase [Actinokineospora bangkokensis]OLR91594.1 2-phospho-L-lactate guanylyltransferase [Actinokineospora bangkokensis]